MSQARIFAVMVLYKRSLEESETFSTLRSLLQKRTDLAGAISLLLYDNSPVAQEVPVLPIPTQYISNPANPGLAAAYSAGLQLAGQETADWLLLLDQDTTLTPEYLEEISSGAVHLLSDRKIVAIVPKLSDKGVLCSPLYPPTYGPARMIDRTTAGDSSQRLHAFNSGAVLRVSALKAIGGFPEDFPLDYLDHATFAALQDRGGRLHILNAILEHELSSNVERNRDPNFVQRQTGILDAEYRFYKQYGSAGDRLRRRLRLIRASLGRVLRRRDRNQTWRMLKSAFRP
jgi:GT2 family glycosyltransferase